jgi:SM-20-related protein
MERGVMTPAEIFENGYVVNRHVRNAFDVEIEHSTLAEVDRLIDRFRGDVSEFFGVALQNAEGCSFLRYLEGGFYRAHRDRIDDADPQWPRRVSLVLFLTTAGHDAGAGCEGGALRLYNPRDPSRDDAPFDIPPVEGTLVAFRSNVLHEVLPVTAGVRDTVVNWFY